MESAKNGKCKTLLLTGIVLSLALSGAVLSARFAPEIEKFVDKCSYNIQMKTNEIYDSTKEQLNDLYGFIRK